MLGSEKLPGDSFARSKGSSKRPLEGLQVLEVTGDGDGSLTFGELLMFHAFFWGKSSFQALMVGKIILDWIRFFLPVSWMGLCFMNFTLSYNWMLKALVMPCVFCC